MTNEAAFNECWINLNHKLLGYTLKPLCLLHLQWMYNIESPLVITSKPATITDVEIGALICSSGSNGEIFSKLNSKGLLNRLKRFLWHRSHRKQPVQEALLAFVHYQNDYCSLPEFFNDEQKESDNPFSWLLLHSVTLIKNTGWMLEQVYTMPIGQVVWLNLAFAYLNTGETSLKTDKEALAEKALASLTSQNKV